MDEVSLYDHVSDWTFEQIAAWFARWYEPTNIGLLKYPNMNIAVDLFHWCEDGDGLIIDELMNDKPLYVADNSSCWNPQRRSSMSLQKLTCTIQNPLCLLEQGIYLEYMEQYLPPRIAAWEKATQRRVDAVIYTPHPYMGEPELRQMKLLYPAESIQSILPLG